MSAVFHIGVALLLFTHVGTLFAQAAPTEGAALNWVRLPGAEGCITSAELAQRVEARLERRVFVLAQHAELSFDGYVQTREAGGFAAHLAVSNAQGQLLGSRDIESADANCRAVDDALVLITALTLFPGDFGLAAGGIALDAETNARLHALFADEPSELDPADLPEYAGAPNTASRATSAPKLAPASPKPTTGVPDTGRVGERTRVAVEAAPVLSLGVLPGIGFGVSAELTVALRQLWPVRLGYGHFFTRDARASEIASGVGHFARDEITLFACPLGRDEDFGFELCVGTALGLLRVTTDGFASRGTNATDPMLDVGGQGAVRLRIFDTWTARVALTALLPLVQHSYDYQALDGSSVRLFRSPQVAARLQIAMGAEF